VRAKERLKRRELGYREDYIYLEVLPTVPLHFEGFCCVEVFEDRIKMNAALKQKTSSWCWVVYWVVVLCCLLC
jgi:hypothetical protein